jgi:hypothetical protein
VLRILLISSKNDSFMIYVSEKRNNVGVSFEPACFNSFLKSSFQAISLYDLVISIEKVV